MIPQRTKAAPISASRWTAYAVAGLATAPGLVSSAEGEIHYSGRIDFQLIYGDTLLPLSGGFSLLFRRHYGFDGNYDYMFVTPGPSAGVATDRHYLFSAAARLRHRVNVSAQPHFNDFAFLVSASQYGEFKSDGQGFAAFRFEAGSGYQYGWVRIRTTLAGRDNQIEIVDYAWADPGEPILTGQKREGDAPAPDAAEDKTAANPTGSGSLGLLAFGSAGLLAWRKGRGPAR